MQSKRRSVAWSTVHTHDLRNYREILKQKAWLVGWRPIQHTIGHSGVTSQSSRSDLNPTRTSPSCYSNTTLGNHLYAQPIWQTQSVGPARTAHISVLLTVNIVSHNPAQSSSDNIPSLPSITIARMLSNEGEEAIKTKVISKRGYESPWKSVWCVIYGSRKTCYKSRVKRQGRQMVKWVMIKIPKATRCLLGWRYTVFIHCRFFVSFDT